MSVVRGMAGPHWSCYWVNGEVNGWWLLYPWTEQYSYTSGLYKLYLKINSNFLFHLGRASMTCFRLTSELQQVAAASNGKLTHHALFKMLLLPAGLCQPLGPETCSSRSLSCWCRGWHVKVRVWSSTCLLGLRLPLKKKIKVLLIEAQNMIFS